MLLAASSFGGGASLHRARGFHQLRRGADGCSSRSRPRERRSDLARTPAEVLVADLNRPARGRHGRGHALGLRRDCALCFYTAGRSAPPSGAKHRSAPSYGRYRFCWPGSEQSVPPADSRKHADKTGEVDTEHMFGFTEGSDVGEAGEKELEVDSTGRFGRLGGSYNNVATALEAKYSFSERFRLSVDATIAYYDISGVSGLDDRRRGALQSVSFDARYRLLDRERAPFGLTLSVEPHWGFADEVSGAPADQQRAEFRLLADRELIPGRLFAALNVIYEPEQTRLRGSGETLRDSTLGVSAALAMRVTRNVFIGAEARSVRQYEGLGLDR